MSAQSVPVRHTARATLLSLIAAVAIGFAAILAAARPAGAVGEVVPVGLSRLLAAYDASAITRGIATFDAVPNALQVGALRALGLEVQPMQHVPLALVAGPVAAMQAAVNSGTARDVYPDEPIDLFDTASSDAMGSASLRAAGLTGGKFTYSTE